MLAYACRLSESNLGAIASEKPDFDLDDTIAWMNEHGDGYFIRDEEAPWDCKYMSDDIFEQMYHFLFKDVDAIFRQIRRID